jgi:membrane associated rhomboid family serine protease
MKFLSSLPTGARALLLLTAFAFPLSVFGSRLGLFDLYAGFGLSPVLVWKGQLWRLVTYAILPLGFIDWLISLFWLATLVSIVGRHWSSGMLLSYCLTAAAAGSSVLVLLIPDSETLYTGWHAITFGLLVAWYRIYGREKLVLLGIGEISVRHAAVLVGIMELLLLLCLGWPFIVSTLMGGAAGGCSLAISKRRVLSRPGQAVESERIARLEL